ncbi:serine/threonine-protein kinase [Nocardia stercoris]|uniref:serine/threonine-protein kinase n=1 Tax=Nocardia stercoris TaxID=2483361 RepID=UPI002685E7B4
MNPPRTRTGMFGPYELRSLLGRGGMGEVYEAFDTGKSRVVALKLLNAELALDPAYRERFRREAQAAARLSDPHVIPIHDWGELDGALYIDMRLVNGSDLHAVLRDQGPMPAARAVHVIGQVAAALDAAHAAGLVHRDVKPANILLTAGDFTYLADFGIARSDSDSALTQTGAAVGSYTYMAPERFDVGPVTGRADIYSLGCVLHECLTGAVPFPAPNVSSLVRAHLSDPPPRPSAGRGDIPAAMDAVLARAMAKAPADRYASAGEFAAAAMAALQGADAAGAGAPPAAAPRVGPTPVFGGETTVFQPFGAQGPALPPLPSRQPATPPAAAEEPAEHFTEPAETAVFRPFGPDGPTLAAGQRFARRASGGKERDSAPAAPPAPPVAAPPAPATPPAPPATGANPEVPRQPRTYDTTGTLRIFAPPSQQPEHNTGSDLPTFTPADPTVVRPADLHLTPLPPTGDHPVQRGPFTGPASAATQSGSGSGATPSGSFAAAPQSGSMPAASQSGSLPGAPQSGSLPAASQSGPFPAASQSGGLPAASQPGSFPAASQSGGLPAASQSGTFPAASQSGGFPAASQSGSFPAASQSGSFPATTQFGGAGDTTQQSAGGVGRPNQADDLDATQVISAPTGPASGYPLQENYGGPGGFGNRAQGHDDRRGFGDQRNQGGYGDQQGFGGGRGYGGDQQGYGGDQGGYGSQQGYGEGYEQGFGGDGYGDQGGYGGFGHGEPNGYGYDDDPATEYAPAAAAYHPPSAKRKLAVPIVIGVLFLAVVCLAAVVGWQTFSNKNTATDATATATTAVAPATTGSAAASTTRPTTTTSAGKPPELPKTAVDCPATYPAVNGFSRSATGSKATTCQFAEEVRKVYAQSASAGTGTPATVVAVSPVTNQSYSMSCTTAGRLVTCTGGENAVVYVY